MTCHDPMDGIGFRLTPDQIALFLGACLIVWVVVEAVKARRNKNP